MTIFRVLILIIAAAFVTACDNDGPMERAGEKIDNAASDAGNAVEDACEDAKEGMGADDTDC
jgi:predicted small secreted protein